MGGIHSGLPWVMRSQPQNSAIITITPKAAPTTALKMEPCWPPMAPPMSRPMTKKGVVQIRVISGRQSVDRSFVMPAKAGIQANAAEFGAARLDSRLRGSDESGQRTGSLV
jgi:hypothetical protein